MIFFLSGCFVSNEPTTKRAKQHYEAINSVVEAVDKYGFGGGSISKQCEIPMGCTENNFYKYISSENLNPDGKFSVEEVCENFIALGEQVSYDFWRRDMHESEDVDVTSSDAGLVACIESMNTAQTPADGGSEGFIIKGQIDGFGKPIALTVQLNSYMTEEKFHEYAVMVFTSDEIWPVLEQP